MDPKFKETLEGELAQGTYDALDRIASALELLSKCVWKNPDGDYKFQIEHSDRIRIEEK